MSESTDQTESVSFMLSRHELLVMLDALRIDAIPGLAVDPLGDFSPEQEELARIVARRAMQARGFLRMKGDELAFHQWLIKSISACAFAPRTLMIMHRSPDIDAPQIFYAHLSGDATVVHAVPNPVLHTFLLLPSSNDLIEQILEISGPSVDVRGTKINFELSRDIFVKMREQVEAGKLAEARAFLIAADTPQDTAIAFVHHLASTPTLTVFQLLNVSEEGDIVQQDFTVMRSDEQSWLLISEGTQIEIGTITKMQFHDFLSALL